MADEFRLPRREEIATLPRWAQVALAVRCARRAQPLFTLAWPDAPKEQIQAVERAITIAAILAAGDSASLAAIVGSSSSAAAHAADPAYAASDPAYAAARAADAAHAASDAARAADAAHAASDAAHAADSARAATHAAYDAAYAADSAYAYAYAADAADAADAAAFVAGPRGLAIMDEAIARDFTHLQAAATEGHWTHDTRVDPGDTGPLGPLWSPSDPTFAPDWKTLAAEHNAATNKIELPTTNVNEMPKRGRVAAPPLTLYIEAAEEDEEDIADLLIALSDMHRAAGGLGLTFEGRETRVVAACEVPA